jgi:hypothetical protein
MNARSRFAVNDRVKYSDVGITRFGMRPELSSQRGTVRGFSRRGDQVRVQWDGKRTIFNYFADYIDRSEASR